MTMRKKKNTVMKLYNAFNRLLSGLNPEKKKVNLYRCQQTNQTETWIKWKVREHPRAAIQYQIVYYVHNLNTENEKIEK